MFCKEIKWIDTPILISDRTYFDSRWHGQYRWYSCYDDVYGVHSQLMLDNLA